LADSLSLLRTAAEHASLLPVVAPSEPAAAPDEVTDLSPAAQPDLVVLPQGDGDLGDRLLHTFAELRRHGQRRVVIFGCDSPTLPPERLWQAHQALAAGHDAVLGPAEDGGFYLIGTARELTAPFTGVAWGTGEVLRQTREGLRRCGATVALLPPWYDVDRPEDVDRLRLDLESGDAAAPRTARFIAALVRAGRLPLAPPPG
jgi:uncharacterized protein